MAWRSRSLDKLIEKHPWVVLCMMLGIELAIIFGLSAALHFGRSFIPLHDRPYPMILMGVCALHTCGR